MFELLRVHVSNSHEGPALCYTKEEILPAERKCVGLSVKKIRLL